MCRMQVQSMALLGLQTADDVNNYGRQALQDATSAAASLLDRVNRGVEASIQHRLVLIMTVDR